MKRCFEYLPSPPHSHNPQGQEEQARGLRDVVVDDDEIFRADDAVKIDIARVPGHGEFVPEPSGKLCPKWAFAMSQSV